MTRTSPGQVAADALEWAASGRPRPPESIAALPTGAQVALAREANRLARIIRDKLTELDDTPGTDRPERDRFDDTTRLQAREEAK